MEILQQVSAAIGEIAAKVGPSVVGIGNRWGLGSGVVLETGKVLTNAHNLRSDEVTVTFHDGRTAKARAIGVDGDGDLAVLGVDTDDAPALGWAGENGSVDLGAPVFALSNPGGRGLRVTLGFVSGTQRSFRGPRGRRITGSLEHTAPLLPGSSGGPVVDAGGRLLGLNTNRLGEGFYLAIPANEDLHRQVEALSRGESPSRPMLGVAIAPPEVARRLRRAVGLPEAQGVLVRQVEEDSAAAGAGVKQGDLLVEVAGRPVDSIDRLHEAIASWDGTSSLELKVLRGAEEHTLSTGAEQ
ncbi:MAG: S1C family serine protease [Actinomycetota bacterium]